MAPGPEEDNAVTQPPLPPEFDREHSSNKTATVDGSVILNCRVRHVGSRTVSGAAHARGSGERDGREGIERGTSETGYQGIRKGNDKKKVA